jgi:hypothetical protein
MNIPYIKPSTPHHAHLIIPSPPVSPMYLLLSPPVPLSAQLEPDIFTIASESEALGGPLAQGLRNRRARLVDISRTTCLCPNCGGKLIPLLLDEEERKRVRLGLMKIASTASLNQLRNIQVMQSRAE